MSNLNMSASKLLVENLSLFNSLDRDQGVLDLACGSGRNGLFLVENKIPVIFADKNSAALEKIASITEDDCDVWHKCWEVDLEHGPELGLGNEAYSAVLVFNYLHRPLFPAIKSAISRAGLIFYETFTVRQPNFGRPKNPDYLLREDELLQKFEDWKVIDYFEGVKQQPERAVASLIARKP